MASEIIIACNNPDNGQPEGYTESVEIDGITMVGGRVTVGYENKPVRGAKLLDGLNTFRLGRIRVPAMRYEMWYGNWCCDRIKVECAAALKCLNYLAKNPDWHCEEGVDSIFEAVNERRVVTPQEWERYNESLR